MIQSLSLIQFDRLHRFDRLQHGLGPGDLRVAAGYTAIETPPRCV